MAVTSFIDKEFGEIRVKRTRQSRRISIRVATDGRYQVAAPLLTPIIYIKQVVNSSRNDLRELARNTSLTAPYQDGQVIGKNHQLAVVPTMMVSEPHVSVSRQRIIVQLPPDQLLTEPSTQQLIRDHVVSILRKEAREALPPLIHRLADEHGFRFTKLRFSHSGGRWGSCTSAGTITLNIALMKLPDELIRYVLVHELCHTRQMNHSKAFWEEVKRYDPHYLLHRRQIKQYSPTV
jgi:predicted metal-dependent hydrolase